ncbi:hypothetical protein ACNPOQ_24935 [Pseudomonas shirazensis]
MRYCSVAAVAATASCNGSPSAALGY